MKLFLTFAVINCSIKTDEAELKESAVEKKLSKEQFVLAAIKALRDKRPDSHSIPATRVSALFLNYFGVDLMPELEKLEERGKVIMVRKRLGRIRIYNPKDLPQGFRLPPTHKKDISEKLQKILEVAKENSEI